MLESTFLPRAICNFFLHRVRHLIKGDFWRLKLQGSKDLQQIFSHHVVYTYKTTDLQKDNKKLSLFFSNLKCFHTYFYIKYDF